MLLNTTSSSAADFECLLKKLTEEAEEETEENPAKRARTGAFKPINLLFRLYMKFEINSENSKFYGMEII